MQLITNSPRRSSVAIGRFLWPVVAFVVGALIMNAVARRHTTGTANGAPVQHDVIAVREVQGEVEYKRGEGGWQAVTLSTEIAAGDQIRIVGAGRAALDLKGLAVLRLGADSASTIAELNDQKISLTHDRGAVYLRLPKDDSAATVRTPLATYELRGRSAAVYAGEVSDGVAAITATATVKVAGADDQTVTPGQQYYVATKDTKSLKTVIPLSDISVLADEFLQWNATADRTDGISNDDLGILGAAPQTTTGQIRLTAATTDKGVVVTWKIEGTVDVSHGFKVARSESRNPEFPGSAYQSEPQSTARTHTWDITDGKTYHFRVCQYQADGTCGLYSNDVAVAAPSAS